MAERQRLCIARAILRKAELFLFDDSFSALDYATEASVREALVPALESATVIIVAERISSIVDAGQILVLNDGRLVARGLTRTSSGLPGPTVRSPNRSSPWTNCHERRTCRREAGEHFPGGSLPGSSGSCVPVRGRMSIAVAATCGFAALNVAAPKLLGDATDVVVAPFVGGTLDEGKLAGLLLLVALMYVGTSLFNWLQGALTASAVQRLVFGLRAAVEAKLHRLPSSHFQEQTRGDVLSRATNDVDNISQSLNQLLTQVIMAVLMLLGSLAMMLWISPLLAVIALISVPISTLITVLIARKSQADFADQWASTGTLNAHIEEFVTGHEVIKAFGQHEAVAEIFGHGNDRLAQTSARAQYVSGAVQPVLVFIANLNYVAVAVVGALQVAAGTMTIGSIQAFIQFSRLFTQPMGQIGGMLTLMQSCAASAERVFSLLDARRDPPGDRSRPPGAGKPGRAHRLR